MGCSDRTMPWLGEGMAVYLTIKHLGTKNSACVDFATEKHGRTRSAPTKKKKKEMESWFGDIEKSVNSAALDDSADKFMTIIQIPEYHKFKPESMAKAFSMIDFMIENDRIGFLKFVEGLQKHTRFIFKRDGLRKFYDGMDPLIAECFAGAAVKKGRKVVPLDSMDALEELWKEWAAEYTLRKR
jgi:hypothetical protein